MKCLKCTAYVLLTFVVNLHRFRRSIERQFVLCFVIGFHQICASLRLSTLYSIQAVSISRSVTSEQTKNEWMDGWMDGRTNEQMNDWWMDE